ncbi:large conductance mechanosensitive channel [Allocatelliglobosispora scoriae]|uniref:Large-conductance mechanosensitive channel n=1 Tax=Allocatelliglobosispora scoriae TaxID=643052 RepID=A0A841BXS0_9ACTN|nr:large conductance mechanosensitive channel protein MscL [Allocatelliglobosispora scoriae]MBB5872455.1 large conductance mechanosensitive channel [Allocatelliglobosispora scoriae]
MLKGFRDFVMRGNVVDLAVGVVIGAAFTTVVTSFTDSFLKPLIGLVGATGPLGAVIKLPGAGPDITWGAFVSTLISFVMTASVVYFLVVLPMNKLAERRKRDASPAPASVSEEVALLREIRDALVAGRALPHQREDLPTSADTDSRPNA